MRAGRTTRRGDAGATSAGARRGGPAGAGEARCRSRRGDHDRGSASVLVLAVLGAAALLAGTLALAASGRALAAHVASAADLAALAGARAAAAPWRGEAPCDVAAQAASRNEVELVTCTVDTLGVVDVTVSRHPRGGLAAVLGEPRRATSRAGPEWVRDAERQRRG